MLKDRAVGASLPASPSASPCYRRSCSITVIEEKINYLLSQIMYKLWRRVLVFMSTTKCLGSDLLIS